MAHFAAPPDGELGEYDVDNRLAVGSIWRMQVGVGGQGAEVALWGGAGLSVRSNNPGVIANPIAERTSGEFRVFRLKGLTMGATMLEASPGSGPPWVSLQVQVLAKLERKTNGDHYITLSKPHMALNASDTPVTYHMQYDRFISSSARPADVMAMATSTGVLKHLVFSSHGHIKREPNGAIVSIINIGTGLTKQDVEVFDKLKQTMGGGVIWFGACGIGNDNEQNKERAVRSTCYVVAPVMYMQPRSGQPRKVPLGKIDMYDRFIPKVFTPSGGMMPWPSFLQLGKRLGFQF
ncbi:hypothetical protein WME90_42805 [Sorangium sp. So ce375]|uniref:hypothetical protein n=1 Tax=Sorangium sp. So ce375 TaxID=3133306 RepID=UPI003F5B6349